jgi:hypothetical protein
MNQAANENQGPGKNPGPWLTSSENRATPRNAKPVCRQQTERSGTAQDSTGSTFGTIIGRRR